MPMQLDPSIILNSDHDRIVLGQRELDQRKREGDARIAVDQQEAELRRQEILARREEIVQRALERNQPKEWDPGKANQALTYQQNVAKAVYGQLKQVEANPDTWVIARRNIGQLLGPEALTDLPEDVNEAMPSIKMHIASYPAEVAKAESKTREITVTNPDGTQTIQIVEDKPGQTFTSAAKPAAAGATGFTLSPGQIRYGADNTEIAHAPDRPEKAAAGPKLKSVTSGDANRLAELNNSIRDLDVLSSTISGVKGATGPSAAVGAALPNFVTNITGIGTEAKEKQAMIDRVKQVIGKALEGGVLRKEDEDKYKKILPTISDAPDVVTAKLTGLREAIDRKRDEQLSALEDAGYDTSRFRAREGTSKDTNPKKTTPKRVGRFTVEEAN